MRAEDAQLWEHANQLLERDGELELPWTQQAFDWLLRHLAQPPARMLDVGCGPAVASCLFAQMSPATQVTGVDATPAFLRQGAARVSRLGLSDRVHVLEGDLSEGLDVPAADLVWAARVVHHLSDPVAGLVELGRLTSPGGLLAVIEGGLPIRVLPGGYGVGRPGFMSRLEAVLSDHFIDAYDLPERVTSGTEDWPLLMAEAGLEHLASRSFLLDLPAPVEPWVRAYLLDKFAHLWDMVGPKLDPPDAEALARLTDPTDSLGIHQRLDLFVLAAHTVHLATTH